MKRKKRAETGERSSTAGDSASSVAHRLLDEAARFVESAAVALIVAESLGIKTKRLEHFVLAPAERQVLLTAPKISSAIRRKLAATNASFTVAEIAGMTMSLAEASIDGGPQAQIPCLLVAGNLAERLREAITKLVDSKPHKPKAIRAKSDPDTLYQFRITLKGSTPPIWRRIQVPECTLDKLHEFIQSAMGWKNCHLHQFKTDAGKFGNPAMIRDGFEKYNYLDSTRTRISEVVPKSREKCQFTYEYDFGDSWLHELHFEGCPAGETGQTYPVCLEGERACPPEDVGGIGGFHVFLQVVDDPLDEEYDAMMEWSGNFDPEKFNAGQATRKMRKVKL